MVYDNLHQRHKLFGKGWSIVKLKSPKSKNYSCFDVQLKNINDSIV
jgi:hypothetical protein